MEQQKEEQGSDHAQERKETELREIKEHGGSGNRLKREERGAGEKMKEKEKRQRK